LAQPKPNVGDSFVGSADRRTVAPDTVPFSAQTLTIHLAVCPRSMLDCERSTSTHRLATGEVAVLAVYASRALGEFAAAAAESEAEAVFVALGVGESVALAELAGVADVVALAAVLAGLAVGLAAGFEVGDAVAILVAFVLCVEPPLGLADADAFVDPDEDDDVDGEAFGVGVGVGVLVVLAGLGAGLGDRAPEGGGSDVFVEVELLVGDVVELGEDWTSAHSSLVPVTAEVADTAAEASAVFSGPTEATSEYPVVPATRTPPVTRLIAAGRTCAKRMRSPARAARCCQGTTIQYVVATSSVETPNSSCTPTIGHQTGYLAPLFSTQWNHEPSLSGGTTFCGHVPVTGRGGLLVPVMVPEEDDHHIGNNSGKSGARWARWGCLGSLGAGAATGRIQYTRTHGSGIFVRIIRFTRYAGGLTCCAGALGTIDDSSGT
jgi:hypothetical protein